MEKIFKWSIGLLFITTTTLLTTACSHRDKPQVAPAVKVEVQELGKVAGDSGQVKGIGASAYSGTVLSGETSLVSFSVPGKIINIYVDKGDRVTKGQTLARVKSESLENQRNIAQAGLEQVQDLYNRLKILHDSDALPEVQWVEVQSKLKQAENAVSLADRAVSDATLTAPISGYVADKMSDVGQDVIMAQPVLKIVDTGSLKISISVPEDDVSRFDANSTAEVVFPSLNGLTVKGVAMTKDVEANPLTRSYEVRFDIPDGGGKILPGMIGNVSVAGLATGKAVSESEIFVVPSQSVLLSSDNRQFVWVVKDGRAERKFVVARELSDNGVAVESGLARGDSLIIGGMSKVSTGTMVTSK